MTTQTRVLPDLDEALDFEPVCEHNNCERQARWSRTHCGHALTLSCTPHKAYVEHLLSVRDDGRCAVCGMVLSASSIVWWPL